MKIERYGGGFIIADYSRQDGRHFAGQNGIFYRQPITAGSWPFSTEAEANEFIEQRRKSPAEQMIEGKE